ncbi:Bro-N domain-containing protein [uncultured Pseudoramibacter sp.]|uniref:BRO-N domain-containing protein n=1 Tax=uncultured Pseudoramibacter sp. TaxID=1623493 RepID=UPI00342CDB0E
MLFGQVRAVEIDGAPWFVGKDVAKALGYSNTKDAIKSHVDEEDKKFLSPQNRELGNIPNRGLQIINESGLYSLILSSKLPTAKKFKHWVTSEILPSIRQHGEDDDKLTRRFDGSGRLALFI